MQGALARNLPNTTRAAHTAPSRAYVSVTASPSPTRSATTTKDNACSSAAQPSSSTPRRAALTASERETLRVQQTRNISIVAHIDAGKTTTTERMLYYAGVLRRVGEVDSGTTTTDFMKEEMERGITIQSAAVSLSWRDHTINLIDTPGHMDFTVEVERAMRVVDGVVALFDASAGVQAQSYTVLQQSRKFGAPLIAFLNKMDKFNADFDAAVASIAAKLRVQPVLLQLPLHTADGSFDGVVDLVDMQTVRFTGAHGATRRVRSLQKGAERQPSTCDGQAGETGGSSCVAGTGAHARWHDKEGCRIVHAPMYANTRNREQGDGNSTNTVTNDTEDDSDEYLVHKARAGRHTLVSALAALDDTLMEELLRLLEEAPSHAAACDSSAKQSNTAETHSRAYRMDAADIAHDSAQRKDSAEEEEECAAAARLPAASIHAAVRRILLHQQHALMQQQRQQQDLTQSRPWQTSNELPIVPLVPVLCGAARRNQGVQPLLDAVTRYLPAPSDRVLFGRNRVGQLVPMPTLSVDPNGEVFALAFKVIHTLNPRGSCSSAAKRQPLVFLRVYQGRITPRMRLRNRTRANALEVVEAVYVIQAEERVEVPVLLAGQIGAVFLQHTYTGDTLVSAAGGATTRTSAMSAATSSHSAEALAPSSSSAAESDIGFFGPQTVCMLTARFASSGGTAAHQQQQQPPPPSQQQKQPSRSSSSTHTQSVTPVPTESSFDASLANEVHTPGAAMAMRNAVTDTCVYTLEGIDSPPAVLSFSIEASTKKDVPLLETGLAELTREDPSLRVGRDNFGHVVISGMGELHLEIALSRLRREYCAQCRLLRAVIEYRETITTSHVLAGLVGTHVELPHMECTLELQPMHSEEDESETATSASVCFAIDDDLRERIGVSSVAAMPTQASTPSTEGGLTRPSLPLSSQAQEEGRASHTRRASERNGAHSSARDKSHSPQSHKTCTHGLRHATEDLRCVEQCFRAALQVVSKSGPLAGLPLHGVRVVLTEFRKVGLTEVQEKVTSEVARSLLVRAFRSVPRNKWAVIEPMVSVQVHLSDTGYVGGVVNSLNQHRATTVEVQGEGHSVYAVVALRNIVHYSIELRRVVKGHANFFTKLHHYRRVEDQSVKSRILSNLGVTQSNGH